MRILAIDDDLATLELVSSVLTCGGLECLTASNAEEALGLIAREPGIAVAISDISMPGMDGISLLEHINTHCSPASAPGVIFLTAHARVDYAVAALRLGALDFLIKPVRPQNVLSVVRKAVARIEHSRSSHVALLGMTRLRRLRREFPPLADLDDVACDLLQELVRAERRGERLSVSSLSMAAEQMSPSTAMRRIQGLVQMGLITRTADPTDARREFVALTPSIRATLEEYLQRVAREFAAAVPADRAYPRVAP